MAEINPNNPNFPIIYSSNYFLIQSGMDRQGRFRQGKGVVGGLIEERAVDGRSPYCPGLSSKRTFGLLSPRWGGFFLTKFSLSFMKNPETVINSAL